MCPRCSIQTTNIAEDTYTLCKEHQLSVLLVEHLAKDIVLQQICTPHQPVVIGAPPSLSDSADGAGGKVLGALLVVVVID